MPLETLLPTPEACILGENTLRVADFTELEWPVATGDYVLTINYAGDGVEWQPIGGGLFSYETGRDVTTPGTLTPGFRLRYEDEWIWGDGPCFWDVVADTEAETPPAGYHYEYEWSGDIAYSEGNEASLTTVALDTSPTRTATVLAKLVRNSDSAVICTATDTWGAELECGAFVPPAPYEPIFGEEATITEECAAGPSEVLEVELSPDSGCPGDTIEAAGSYPLTGATLDGGPLGLTPSSGLSVAFTIPASIVAPGVFPIVFTTDEAIDTTTDTVSLVVGEECFDDPPLEECVPPAPVACWASTVGYQVEGVAAGEFPDCTEALTFEQFVPGGSWVEKQLNVVAGQGFTVAQSILAGVKGRFKSGDGTTGPEVEINAFCCAVVPPDEAELPAVPDAPELARDCEAETITVASPDFVPTGNAQTASIEIRRRALPEGEWATVHTFTEAGSWVDENVVGGVGYEYAARACNTSGCSAWSDEASISLSSETLALTWQSPAEEAEVVRSILLRFAAVDAGGVEDLQVFVNGALLSSAPARVSGTATNGVYTLPLDTRRAAQGAAVVTVVGTGSDGCKKRAELNLVFANTRALGVLYRDFHTESALSGQEIARLPISLGLGALDPDPSRRYWGQAAITKDTALPVVTDETEPEAAQTAFDAMQPFPLVQTKSWPSLGANPPGSVLYGIQSVNEPGAQIKIRVRVEQAEGFLAYDTESERVAKIRQVSAGKHLVLAQNPDRVFLFEDDALTLLADLATDEGATAVTDVALVGDKLYYLNHEQLVNQTQLIAFDIDPLTGARQRTMHLSPHGETRRPALIEAVGGQLIALFVDEALPEARTLCMALKADQLNDAWTLDAAATLAWSDGANFWFACGGELYQSLGGVGAPALVKSFNAAITAIGPDAIGLADGSLWVFKEGEWSNPVLASGAAIVAATRAYLNFEHLGALWGKAATPTLFGQDASGGYTVSRALGTYDGVTAQPGGVTALDRYFVPTEAEEGETEGAETEAETAGDERALVGTEGGVLLALSVARQSSAGAWLHSSIGDIEAGGVARLVPVVEEV